MNRKIILGAIFTASFFLIFLGMRIPYLSGGSTPKQRPRAIVENATSKPLEASKPSNSDLAYTEPSLSVTIRLCATNLQSMPILIALLSPPPAFTIARAPPVLSI